MSEPAAKSKARTFTGFLRDIERVVRADAAISSSAYRILAAILAGLNEKSGEFFVKDEVLAVDCGLKQRQSLWEARTKLKAAGLLDFRKGSLEGKKATTYWLLISDQEIDDRLALLVDSKREARERAKTDEPRRADVRERLRSKRRAKAEEGKGSLTHETGATLTNAYIGTLPNAYTLHPQGFTPSDSATDRDLDTGRTRGSETVPDAGADVAPVLPSPSPSSAPPVRSVPVLLDDDMPLPAVPVLRDDVDETVPAPSVARAALATDRLSFKEWVYRELGGGDRWAGVRRSTVVADLMVPIWKEGARHTAGPFVQAARAEAERREYLQAKMREAS